jgi:hypothetical protein
MLLKPAILAKLVVMILVLRIHMVIGLHFWLRIRKDYPRFLPYAYTLVVLIPALAYVGLFRMLRRRARWQRIGRAGSTHRLPAASEILSRDNAFGDGESSSQYYLA